MTSADFRCRGVTASRAYDPSTGRGRGVGPVPGRPRGWDRSHRAEGSADLDLSAYPADVRWMVAMFGEDG